MILVLGVLLLAGSGNAVEWGYLVDENDLSAYQAMVDPSPNQVISYCLANHKSMGGVVHDIDNVLSKCDQVDARTWQTSNATKWRSWNNRQWWTTPYPPNIPTKIPEMVLDHLTVWHASGEFYLVVAPVPT